MITRILATCIGTAALLSADTLIFRNGNRLDGHLVSADEQTVRFAIGSQVNTFNLSELESIRLTEQRNANSGYPQSPSYPPPNPTYGANTGSAPSSYPPPANNNPAPPLPQSPGSYSAPASAPPGNGPSGIQVQAGTQIVVRMIDDVDSERDRLGQTFRASVDQPIVVNGQTVIPRGSDVIATLIDAQKSGRIQGRTALTLDLKSVTLNGRVYDLVTTGVAQTSGSRGERSAKVIGGTAAVGAIIGAIAGGGKGAAIGAGSGAAVGTAAEVATSGQRVRIPSETRLTFTLQNPLDL